MRAQARRTRGCDTLRGLLALPLVLLAMACGGDAEPGGEMAGAAATAAAAEPTPPASEAGALAQLNVSPRHGEWVDVPLPGSDVPIRSWVVHPARADDAPVVIVIMEIFGLTDWIRTVADQMAAEGYIAIAPDLLSGMGPGSGGTEAFASRDDVVAGVRGLTTDEAMRRLDAVRAYALTIPSTTGEVGVMGFCWGGGTSFSYAIHQPGLGAAVVYYGSSPAEDAAYGDVTAPVLGLYGGDDQRVNATIPIAEEALAELGKTYEVEIYDGAGHGFLRAQEDREGANTRASEQAWDRTIAFFREHLRG
ncbi:MAG TPA: dienelactone hydrolase family protein [Longimicrobiales bacterium]|nr:dienelactone hydrolase family protein [Longimicrobiales bacterium]